MADNGKWFKVWTSILADPDFQALSLEQMARWVLLGAMTKLVGTRGVLTLPPGPPPRHLAELLRCPPADLDAVLNALPNVSVRESQNRHGARAVTFANWVKYQEDYTMAARAKKSRSKKRREEKRVKTSTTPPLPPQKSGGQDRPDDLTITRPGRPAGPEEPTVPSPAGQVIQTTLTRLRAHLEHDAPDPPDADP
jgi:hypothetical protein